MRKTSVSACSPRDSDGRRRRRWPRPRPGPETKKLELFAGKWKGESEMKAGPWGPGGKMTSESDCTWFEGGFQLVCRESASGAMGKMKSEAVLGWNGEEKIYKYQGFDSMGMMGSATGTERATPGAGAARTRWAASSSSRSTPSS